MGLLDDDTPIFNTNMTGGADQGATTFGTLFNNDTAQPGGSLPGFTKPQQSWRENLKPLYMNTLAASGDPVEGVAQYKLANMNSEGYTGSAGEGGSGASAIPAGGRDRNDAPPADGGGGSNAGEDGSGTSAPPRQGNGPGAGTASAPRRMPEMYSGDQDPTGGGMASLREPTDPESDAVRGKNWRYLTSEEKERLKNYFTEEELKNINLDNVKLHIGETPWYMPSKADAITLENHVYINGKVRSGDGTESEFDPENNPDHFGLLAHEIAHVGQFQNGMTRPGYLWEAAKDGYMNSWPERDARIHQYPRNDVQRPMLNEGSLNE